MKPELNEQSANPRDIGGRFVCGYNYSAATQIWVGEHRSVATQIKKGERLSPKSEFRKGQLAHNRCAIGELRIRRETHTGLLRAWVKVAEPNIWKKRAVLVWESKHGILKRGYVVHHIDRNSLNDDVSNLAALTRAEHAKEHEGEAMAGGFGGVEARAKAHAARRRA